MPRHATPVNKTEIPIALKGAARKVAVATVITAMTGGMALGAANIAAAANYSQTTGSGASTSLQTVGSETTPSNYDATTVKIISVGHGVATYDMTTTLITYTSATTYSGPDSVVYSVLNKTTNATETSTISLNVTPVGNPDSIATNAGATGSVNVVANDYGSTIDPNSVTLPAASAPMHGTATVVGAVVSYTPAAGFSGTDTFTYTAKDANGTAFSGTVNAVVSSVAVNDVATTPANAAVNIKVLANDQGTFDPASVTVSSAPAHGAISSYGADGSINFAPTAGFSGNDTFQYVVKDSGGTVRSASVAVTVTPVLVDDTASVKAASPVVVSVLANDIGTDIDPTTLAVATAPTNGTVVVNADHTITYTAKAGFVGTDKFAYKVAATSGGTYMANVTVSVGGKLAVNDSSNVISGNSVITNVLANDDPSFLPGSVAIVTAPTHGATTVNADGTVTYSAYRNFSGTDTYTYTANDGAGYSGTATVTLTIAPLAVNDAVDVAQGNTVQINILANDKGLFDPTTVTLTAAQHGKASVNADGSVTYVADPSFAGADTFTYTVSDTTNQKTTATVTANAFVLAVNDTATVNAGSSVNVNVLANDAATADPTSDVLVTDGVYGKAVRNADGTFTYTPNAGFSGSDVFTYKVTDASGGTQQATVTVSVKPVAATVTATSTSGMTTIDVLGSSSGQFDPTTLMVSTQPAHGTAQVVSGKIQYTPTAGYSGADNFAYTVKDTSGQLATGAVNLTDVAVVVPPVAQPPVAQPPVAQPPVAQPPVAQPPVAQTVPVVPVDQAMGVGQNLPNTGAGDATGIATLGAVMTMLGAAVVGFARRRKTN